MSTIRPKRVRALPAINTSSLPDIVFMLLFFFMVTTVMRTEKQLLKIEEPEAETVQKLENRSLVMYVNIGPPIDTKLGTVPLLQLGDDLQPLAAVGSYIELERNKHAEVLHSKLVTSLKVDRNSETGFVTDVKQELRKANALKINYATKQEE